MNAQRKIEVGNMRKQYQFGQVKIELQMPDEMLIPKNLELFEIETDEVQKVCELEFTDDLQAIVDNFRKENKILQEFTRRDMRILVCADKECRILNRIGKQEIFAMYVEESEAYTHVWLNHDINEMMWLETMFVSVLGLENVMLQNQSLILHSAYMCRNGKAILFSAPSETGKSTQANLWEKYRGTRTINGDRSLLLRKEDGWYAYGWPICGSSKICNNEAYPIQAIVMLHQAKENSIQRLRLFDAVKKLISEITINMWNSKRQIQAMDLIQELAMEVPVYELGCDISEDAVRCLEEVL